MRLEFFADGSLSSLRPGEQARTGSYAFIDATHLKIAFAGVEGLREGPGIVTVKFSGNEMTLIAQEGDKVVYRKAK